VEKSAANENFARRARFPRVLEVSSSSESDSDDEEDDNPVKKPAANENFARRAFLFGTSLSSSDSDDDDDPVENPAAIDNFVDLVLQEKFDKLKNDLVAAKETIGKHEHEQEFARTKIGHLQEENATLTDLVGELEDDYFVGLTRQDDFDKLRLRLGDATATNRVLKNNLTAANEMIGTHVREEVLAQTKISHLQKDHDTLKDRVGGLEDEVRSEKQVNLESRSANIHLTCRFHQLQQGKGDLEVTLAAAVGQLHSQKQDALTLEAKLKHHAREQKEVLESGNAKLEMQVAELETQVEFLQGALADLRL
jgi:chromosome segregation ATPase